MRVSSLLISLVLCASASTVTGKECPKKSPTQRSITLVNLKTIKTDGTAVAFIESGACPVKIASGDALFEEKNKHHQAYNVTLGNGSECEINGWDTGPTTMECLKDGRPDKVERVYLDAGYKAQPCPKGCDAECKAIDPKWNANALQMFAFSWQEKVKDIKPRSSITITTTVTPTASPKARRRALL